MLAVILGPAAEITFRQSLLRSGGSFAFLLHSSITVTLMAALGVLLAWNIYRSLRRGPVAA